MKKKTKADLAAYLFHEGTNFHAYEYMGVHKTEGGYTFRVWAPNASGVYVTGDFCSWDDSFPMQRQTEQGIWAGFVPESLFGHLSKYKFIIDANGKRTYKADPYAFYCEKPPFTASVYYEAPVFKWGDKKWLENRKKKVVEPFYDMPLNIYEVHALSWKTKEDGEFLNYRELAHELCPYVKQMGYTHIELMPITEFPFDGSWGYQVCGYYAPTSRLGSPDDFKYFVDYMHKAGIGVLIDWVPAHFPKDEHGLYEFDGGKLYEYQGDDKNESRGWGTRKFDVGRNEVQCFLMSNAMYWLREFHIDGLRCDAVSAMIYLDFDKEPGEWFPNAYGTNECLEATSFFKKLGHIIRSEYSDVLFIAEESTSYKDITKKAEWGGLGFNYKWNMGWMNDVLKYFESDPVYRKHMQDKLTFSMFYAFSENYILPISHDEVVHGKKSLLDKMPGEYEQKFAGTRAFLAYMMTHPGKKLLFMGCEIGQFREWDYKGSIEWFLLDYEMHAKFQKYVSDLNNLYLENSQLWEIDSSWDGFQWIDADNCNESILSYIRYNKKGESLIVLLNFTPVYRENFTFGVPEEGVYTELFNSDRTEYGGYGGENKGELKTRPSQWKDFTNILSLNLPGHSAIILKKKKTPGRKKKATN